MGIELHVGQPHKTLTDALKVTPTHRKWIGVLISA
jgi:hypothetical protein